MKSSFSRSPVRAVWLVAIWGGCATLYAQPNSPAQAPKARLSLVSSVDAVAPGQPFDLGIVFKLDKGWHTYWQNGGDAGQAPTVKWTLPEGFAAGEPQYPAPSTHLSPGPIVTYILEHEPVLLVRVVPPTSVPAKTVTLAAKIRYLVCEQVCVIENADLKVELPVTTSAGEVKPANDALIAKARAAMPKASSEHVSVTARTSPAALSPGKKFELLIAVEVKNNRHIPSNQPGTPKLTPLELYLNRVPDVSFDKPVFPTVGQRSDSALGTVNEFGGTFEIRVPGEIDAQAAAGPYPIRGVLKFQTCDDKGACSAPEALAFALVDLGTKKGDAGIGQGLPANPAVSPTTSPQGLDEAGSFVDRFGLVGLFAACFLYGLFINATPCVLPLLSIKVLGFVQQAHESRGRTLALGLSFGAGVILFFVVLGLLASAGKNILQYPIAVIALGTVVTALALSMLGVYTLQVPSAAVSLEQRFGREGALSSFGKGALAPVLGFACTGPLLAGAFGWATQQPPKIAILAFVMAGLGMASPYVLLGANPNWLSFLPKPGNWMITFERIMGFLLLGMVVLLLHPLSTQIGSDGLEWTLVFLVVVAMACWLLGKIDFSMTTAARWRYRISAAALVLLVSGVIYGWAYPLDEAHERQRRLAKQTGRVHPEDWSNGIPWQVWSREAVESAVQSGRTVFVDFTSASCTNCKVNKLVAINTVEAKAKMKSMGVYAFQGDFSFDDPEIAAQLGRFHRPGVPLNLIYPPGRLDSPIVMAPLFTKEELLRRLDEAGPSRVASTVTVGG